MTTAAAALFIQQLIALLVCIGTPLAMASADGKGRRPKARTKAAEPAAKKARTVRAVKPKKKPKIKKPKPHVPSEREVRKVDEYRAGRDNILTTNQVPL